MSLSQLGRTIVMTLILSLASCRTMLVKPGAVAGDFERDMAQCDYEVSLATARMGGQRQAYSVASAAGNGFADGIEIGLMQHELKTKCMKLRGWKEQ